MNFTIEKVSDVKFPRFYPNNHDFLIYAPCDMVIKPGKTTVINLGLRGEMGDNCMLIIRPIIKCNVDEDGFEWVDDTLISSDSDIEWSILVYNLSDDDYIIKKNDVIAKGSFCKKVDIKSWNYNENDVTVRGD